MINQKRIEELKNQIRKELEKKAVDLERKHNLLLERKQYLKDYDNAYEAVYQEDWHKKGGPLERISVLRLERLPILEMEVEHLEKEHEGKYND